MKSLLPITQVPTPSVEASVAEPVWSGVDMVGEPLEHEHWTLVDCRHCDKTSRPMEAATPKPHPAGEAVA
jgi:hypothetical protein